MSGGAAKPELLSSLWTFFFKFVFTTLWIGGFALTTLAMFAMPDAFAGDGDVGRLRWIFLAVTVGVGGILLRLLAPAKRVQLAGSELRISNYLRTISVPLRDVEHVSASVLLNPERVSLEFRQPTAFGSRIVFIPKSRFFGVFTRHPVAERLERLAFDAASGA